LKAGFTVLSQGPAALNKAARYVPKAALDSLSGGKASYGPYFCGPAHAAFFRKAREADVAATPGRLECKKY
jgi:hypothetical protein